MSQVKKGINPKINELLAEARAIKFASRFGEISYEEAKRRTGPMLDQINNAGKFIAKKYKRDFKKITFSDLG